MLPPFETGIGIKPFIQIVEVGPRDGLQSLGLNLIDTTFAYPSTEQKQQWIHRLVESGLTHIEVGAFVHPKKVPAMADTAALLALLPTMPGVAYRVLVPNQQGLTRALAANARHIAVFTAASDGFTQHNIGQSVQESLAHFKPLVKMALTEGLTVRGYVSTIVHCPYNGVIQPDAVVHVTQALLDMGCYEVSLGETLGVAYPHQIEAVVEACIKAGIHPTQLAIHAHDTYGRGLANALAAVSLGIRTVDSSAGGIGGCPFAPGAKGNVATEAVIAALANDYDTGVNLGRLQAATRWFSHAVETNML
jgi:hydroxymethylglutaryl-CoA lyase